MSVAKRRLVERRMLEVRQNPGRLNARRVEEDRRILKKQGLLTPIPKSPPPMIRFRTLQDIFRMPEDRIIRTVPPQAIQEARKRLAMENQSINRANIMRRQSFLRLQRKGALIGRTKSIRRGFFKL